MSSLQCRRCLRYTSALSPTQHPALLRPRKPALTSLLVSVRSIGSKHGNSGTKDTTTERWTAQGLVTLKASASNFSSFSRGLRKEDDSKDASHTHSHSHSHSHGLFSTHQHGSEEFASKIELLEHNKAGSRITLIGMGANFGMSVAKGLAGIYLHSSSLLADAAHSMSDIIGDAVTLYTFRKSRQPADASHPYGYGRYEALGTLFISAFLVASGFGIGAHALEQVLHFLPDTFAATGISSQSLIESAKDMVGVAAKGATASSAASGHSLLGHSHSHGMHSVVDGNVVVDPRAIWFGVGSIVINEALFQATMKVGKRTKSNVLIANAWHHRSDSLTSLVAVGAIGGAIMGFPILDAIGGLVVSTMLAKSGASMTVDAIREITDTPPDAHYTDDINKAMQEIVGKVPNVRGFGNIQCRKSGPFVHAHIVLKFGGNATAANIETAVNSVRLELRRSLAFVQDVAVDVQCADTENTAQVK
ncbi:cation efflux family-domain-containing protein [Coemansia spiralis]|nr:cation efflux family-domain-containing protein [Coemansia spiralis]